VPLVCSKDFGKDEPTAQVGIRLNVGEGYSYYIVRLQVKPNRGVARNLFLGV